jgi:hypothetical protein
MSIDWPVQSSAVRQIDGPMTVMSKLHRASSNQAIDARVRHFGKTGRRGRWNPLTS